MTTTDDIAIEAEGVGKRYRNTWALRNCSFRLPAGRVTALTGANGAGKTTLLDLAAGLRRTTTGTLQVQGIVPGSGSPVPGVSHLAHRAPAYPTLTVDETLTAAERLNPDWDAAHARQLIDDAGLDPTVRVRRLSTGQRTRLGLAVALARRPRLLLLDEPLSPLDPLARKEVMGTLLAEATDTGMGVLLSSHVLADVEDSCDHILVLSDGRIAAAGDVEELLARHRVAVGPAGAVPFPADAVVECRPGERQSTLLLSGVDTAPDGWTLSPSRLEDIVLSHLRQSAGDAGKGMAA